MFGTILLALDGSPYAQRAAELVRRLADGGDDVVVLHVTEIMPMHGGVNLDWDREGLEAARRLGRELEQAGVPHRSSWSAALSARWPRSSSRPPATMGPG